MTSGKGLRTVVIAVLAVAFVVSVTFIYLELGRNASSAPQPPGPPERPGAHPVTVEAGKVWVDLP